MYTIKHADMMLQPFGLQAELSGCYALSRLHAGTGGSDHGPASDPLNPLSHTYSGGHWHAAQP